MAGSSHSLPGLHWREWLRLGFRHLQGLASVGLPKQWRMPLAILAVVLLLEIAFSAPIWECLVLVLAGSAIALVLQQMADPTPLFWTAPAEAWDLMWCTEARVNHLWLHRTQARVRYGLDSPRGDGFATKDGFVLLNVDANEVQMLLAAQAAWGDLAEDRCEERFWKGCRTVRLLAAACILLGGLLALTVLGRLELGNILLAIVVSSGAGHAVGRGVERIFASWVTLAIWRQEKAGINNTVVERFTLPRVLWFAGGEGFLVRRVGRLPD